MKCKEEHKKLSYRHGKRGPSSFNIHNSFMVFEKMNIKTGDVFADLGCGSGDYSLYASDLVGRYGKVYAVDTLSHMLKMLRDEAFLARKYNIVTIESDLCKSINLDSNCVDQCLLSTVMHAHKISDKCKPLFPEICRILKPGGFLTVIECKKEKSLFGPPLEMRISPKELEGAVTSYGFRKTTYLDLGYNYMMIFRNTR
jgi:ubiquinone/menaquinone biosynthesis C-methylase UbiE